MSKSLVSVLGLTPKEQNDLGGILGKIRSVSEFLAETLPKAGKSGLLQAIEGAVPWAGAVVEAGEAFAPVKFVVKLFAVLTEVRDPAQLAFLACTLAYERSIEQAVRALGLATVPYALDDRLVAERLAAAAKERNRTRYAGGPAEGTAPFNLEHFSFGDALLHPFVLDCDEMLDAYAEAAGYSPEQRRALQNEVHQRFVSNLKTLISHGATREKFDPLMRRMSLGTGDALIAEALADHAEYQRWLFEEQQVFGKEPFSLAQVYVEADCGVLTWGQIRGDCEPQQRFSSQAVDPFMEEFGGRHPLGEVVLELMGDPELKDAIVIQGVAGAGKSAFTLWLATELVRKGLRPIRVLLRDVRLDADLSLTEDLTQGIRLTEEAYRSDGLDYSRPDDLLRPQLFKQKVHFGGAEICPYVLILDGWDEISMSVAEGFKLRVGRLLEKIRAKYLGDREVPIRVVLTGRPSTAVTESTFLLRDTPVLTVRPFDPQQVATFVSTLADRLHRPLVPLDGTGWQAFDAARFEPALASYRGEFEEQRRGAKDPEDASVDRSPRGARLEVLGLPLLLHLAVRLMSDEQVRLESVITNPTNLLRSLVDLTCAKAGKEGNAQDEVGRQYRIAGGPLRELLRWTAAAMTVSGRENISYEELRLRLKPARIELAERVEQDTESFLTALMVSYYFKGGRTNLGCEFLHKSFREYLFAEGVVEILKEFGREERNELRERELYWQDFEARDPRRRLSRDLARWLSPQWLTPEVVAHLEQLIKWELWRTRPAEVGTGSADPGLPDGSRKKQRAGAGTYEGSKERPGEPTARLELGGWLHVRDALADVWDWWAEGVHLRPQPEWDERENLVLKPAAVHEMTAWKIPADLGRGGGRLPDPSRYIVSDGNLGDALFRLAACVHFGVAVEQGWLERRAGAEGLPNPGDLWRTVTPIGRGPRRCQCATASSQGAIRLFSPSGRSPQFFEYYTARINGSGWRQPPFPVGCDLRGIDLRGVRLAVAETLPLATTWDYANLEQANAVGSSFHQHSMRAVNGTGADFRRADVDRADFSGALLAGTLFIMAAMNEVLLLRADIRAANLEAASLYEATLTDADLRGAQLTYAFLGSAILRNADLRGADGDVPFSVESRRRSWL